MRIPRNAYCRHLARKTGATLHKASSLPIEEWIVNGRREYFLFDADMLVVRAWMYRERAYRWRIAPWCSVNAGNLVDGGALTVKAIVAVTIDAAGVPLWIISILLSVLFVMYVGKLLL